MTLIKAGNREDAIHALINTWLKDPRKVCGWCGTPYNPITMPCCEQPFIATNLEIFEQFYREMKISRNTRKNPYASTNKKTMRWKLSFPPSLLQYLTKTFKVLYNEELFTKKYNSNWFAKKFGKYFQVAERI